MHILIDDWKPRPSAFPPWKTVKGCYYGAYLQHGDMNIGLEFHLRESALSFLTNFAVLDAG